MTSRLWKFCGSVLAKAMEILWKSCRKAAVFHRSWGTRVSPEGGPRDTPPIKTFIKHINKYIYLHARARKRPEQPPLRLEIFHPAVPDNAVLSVGFDYGFAAPPQVFLFWQDEQGVVHVVQSWPEQGVGR